LVAAVLLEASGLIYQSHDSEYSVYWTATRRGIKKLSGTSTSDRLREL